MNNKETVSYLETLSNVIISATLFLLPIFFLTNTTDFFVIPKQLLIIAATSLLLIVWGIKVVLERKIVLTTNPFNFPVLAFGVVIIISSILSANRFDSLFQSIPVVFVLLFFFAIVNNVKDRKSFSFVLSSFVLGAAVSAVITILYSFKIYFLPIAAIQSEFFNTAGSTIQQLVYLLPILALSLIYIGRQVGFPKIKGISSIKGDFGFFVQLIAGVAVLAGVILIAYQIIFLPNKPVVLPYIYGFQTAAAAISQESQRFIASLIFGSGYGTFLSDFTRFKLASFNLEQNIWNLNFSYSSSYVLELLATTGLSGLVTYALIIVAMFRTRVKKNPLFIALFLTFVLSILLPFSYLGIALLFSLIGIYVAYLNIDGNKRVYDTVLSLVSTKSGMFTLEATPEDETKRRSDSPILPAILLILVLGVVGFLGFFTYKFAISDMKFAQSLKEASANNGQKTYELQSQAITDFPNRSDYHRIFSQVNLALANSVAAGIQPGASPSAQVQQNIVQLLQQSINYARNAVVLSPQTSVNWQNLAQIYRSLINVGENADQFSVASASQAILLDPTNPQLRVQLGGIYFQLKQWDLALQQFDLARQLKPDFSNAYYNLGHTYEEKGDLQSALASYQVVKQLSKDNPDNLKQIDEEIKALEAKIGETASASDNPELKTDQPPLGIPGPSANLPEQDPKLKISPPPASDENASGSAE